MSFLTFSVPSGGLPSIDKASDHKPQVKEQEKGSTLRPGNTVLERPYFSCLIASSLWFQRIPFQVTALQSIWWKNKACTTVRGERIISFKKKLDTFAVA